MVKRAGAGFAREELLLYLAYPREAGGRAKGMPLGAPVYLEPSLQIARKVRIKPQELLCERREGAVFAGTPSLLWKQFALSDRIILQAHLSRKVRTLPTCLPT